jgi:hypothetical protein
MNNVGLEYKPHQLQSVAYKASQINTLQASLVGAARLPVLRNRHAGLETRNLEPFPAQQHEKRCWAPIPQSEENLCCVARECHV